MSRMATAVANHIDCCVYVKPLLFNISAQTSDAPKPLTSTPVYFRKATLLGMNDTPAGSNNSTNVSLGPDSTNGKQPYTIAPGDEIVLEAPLGAKWNFQDWYFKVTTNNDGVVVIYS